MPHQVLKERADAVLTLHQPGNPTILPTVWDGTGVTGVSNARTDLFLRKDGDEADRVDRAVARLTEAVAAGADVLYPVGRHDPNTLRRLTSELPLPVNAIGLPDQDDPASFGPLGVARVRFGPFLQAALSTRAKELLQRWA